MIIVVFMALASISAFAQVAETTKSAAAKPKAEAIPGRVKFDPLRDPKVDLENAIAAASSKGLNIILDVGGEWCGWCVFMDKFFYLNADLVKLRDENFVWIKVNFSDENHNAIFLASYPAASGYPHLYVLDSAGKLLKSQDTVDLEGTSGYDLAKFTTFLKTWSPIKQGLLP